MTVELYATDDGELYLFGEHSAYRVTDRPEGRGLVDMQDVRASERPRYRIPLSWTAPEVEEYEVDTVARSYKCSAILGLGETMTLDLNEMPPHAARYLGVGWR